MSPLEHLQMAYQLRPLPHYFSKVWGSSGRAFTKDSTDYFASQKSPCLWSISVWFTYSVRRSAALRLETGRWVSACPGHGHRVEGLAGCGTAGAIKGTVSLPVLQVLSSFYTLHACDHQLCNHHWEHTTKSSQSTIRDTNRLCSFSRKIEVIYVKTL